MRKIITACALCAVALSANAQCAAEAHAQAAPQDKGSGFIKTASAGTAQAEPGQGSPSGLINVAANTATGMQAADVHAAQQKHDPAREQEHHRRTGPAMLIAALAVMSAIALRRLGASDL